MEASGRTVTTYACWPGAAPANRSGCAQNALLISITIIRKVINRGIGVLPVGIALFLQMDIDVTPGDRLIDRMAAIPLRRERQASVPGQQRDSQRVVRRRLAIIEEDSRIGT